MSNELVTEDYERDGTEFEAEIKPGSGGSGDPQPAVKLLNLIGEDTRAMTNDPLSTNTLAFCRPADMQARMIG
ncbi:hypothetical protein SPF06_18190 [Sinomonas sp. JGH33]|uniref:Uncharacterized protein n=1 Tax=Sinomonas terricola TaxID=3110330 RepID=A0ABU5TAG5_9MICC|nr:hypothetical protein [Sinomonas sp. JGH33]MEA5456658.1 hypothetical protein [Sinomonas sp. JGH33]